MKSHQKGLIFLTKAVRSVVVLLVITAIVSYASPVQSSQVASQDLSEYIVVLNQGVRPTDLGYVPQDDIKESYQATFNGYLLNLSEYEASLLKADYRVISMVKNQPIQLANTDDAQDFPPSWGLDRIDQTEAFPNQIYAYDQYAGQGVIAYIMDSGVDSTHPEFAGRMLAGANFASDSNTFPSSEDCDGHGTHVAGTVGGSSVGVAKKVSISSIRVFNCEGLANVSNIISGLNWIYENHPRGVPAVINMSFGGYYLPDSTMYDPVATLIIELNQIGVYSIAAAGNNHWPTCSQSGNFLPAALTSVIAVGSTNLSDNKAYSSNYGECLEVFAPGVQISSAKNGGGYEVRSGTSMAAPHVAGAAARWLSQGGVASFEDLKTKITGTATTISSETLGTGSPNKLLFIPGNVHVRADTVDRAKDDPGQLQLVYGGGQSSVSFSTSDTNQYSVSESGFVTLKPATLAKFLNIPISATDGISTSRSSITANLRDRPTISSQTYAFNRETLKAGSIVKRALQVQGEGVKSYLVDGQIFSRGVASVDPDLHNFRFETNAIDNDISWSQDIQIFGVDKFGISSFPATITVTKACLLSPASYTVSISGQVGSVSEIKIPTICGEVTDIGILDDWEGATQWRNLYKPNVLFVNPSIAEVVQKRAEISDSSGNKAEVLLEINVSEAAAPIINFDNTFGDAVVHGNISIRGTLVPGIGSAAVTNKFCVQLDVNSVSSIAFLEMLRSSDSMRYSDGCVSLSSGLQDFIINLDTKDWLNGVHKVSVVAYSANGTSTATQTLSIDSQNSASEVSWVSATSGLIKSKFFTLEASASPTGSSSQEIHYWCLEKDSNPVLSVGANGCMASREMQITFNLASMLWQDGEHTFSVHALDQYGRKSNADTLTLTTINSPKITTIVADEFVHGWTLIQLLSESSATLNKICVKLDGSTSGLVVGNDTRTAIDFDSAGCFTVESTLHPYFNLDTTALADRSYELSISTFDELSRQSELVTKQFQVVNVAPSVSIVNEHSQVNKHTLNVAGYVDRDGSAKPVLLCVLVDGQQVSNGSLTLGGQRINMDSDGCLPFNGYAELELTTTGYRNGTHRVSLKVRDSLGKESPIVTQDSNFSVLTPQLVSLTSRLVSDGYLVTATLDTWSESAVTVTSCLWKLDGVLQADSACNPNVVSGKFIGLKPGIRKVSLTTNYSNGDFETKILSIYVPPPKVTAGNTKLKLTCSIVAKGKSPKCSIKATNTLGLTGAITVTPSYLSGQKWISLRSIKITIGKTVSIALPKKTMTYGSLQAKAVISNQTTFAPAVKY